MTNAEMKALIEAYIRYRVRPDGEKKDVRKLMTEPEKGFMTYWERSSDIALAIREKVVDLNTGKMTAVKRFKGFVQWLNNSKHMGIEIVWPEVDISNRFERLIAIAKLLQNQDSLSRQEVYDLINEKLWIGEKTIETDLKTLQEGHEDYAHSVLTQVFLRNAGFAERREPLHFLCSAHPVFLMENLTSVIFMIEALLEKANDSLYHDWLMHTAAHIWAQLTPYAHDKVEKKLRQHYADQPALLKLLEELKASATDMRFQTEGSMQTTIENKLLYCFKAGERCELVLTTGEDEEKLYTGKLVNYRDGQMEMLTFDGGIITFAPSQVLSVERR